MATHVLFESSIGLALFSISFSEQIAQGSIEDITKFGKMVKLVSFVPFKDAAQALEVANDISEGQVHEFLHSLLELNLAGKKNVLLGVEERTLASSIISTLSIQCDASDASLKIIRGIRQNSEKLISGLEAGDFARSQLGLSHAYSRSKVKFNVNRSDNMIIQAIALLDQLDKDVNTFSMRVREWYGWHFPELIKIVSDNYQYAKAVLLIGDKAELSEDKIEELTALLDDDETKAKNVIDAARASMGTDISPVDKINILNFASRVIALHEYRKSLQQYLSEKMGVVAPNLSSLIGDTVGARLISHAGSLTNLSKYPASTVQILGAEKALFRALKTKGNTPKYGLLYHSSFISRAGLKNKGRISRFLANKCTIASRIDCFADTPSRKFGEVLRDQVEERLGFYENGGQVTKNADAMKRALDLIKADGGADIMDIADEEPEKKKSKKERKEKRKSEVMEVDESPKKKSKKDKETSEEKAKRKAEKKEKKEKKSKA